MQNIFEDTRVLDTAARARFGLTEEIMMENAAAALEQHILAAAGSGAVLIVCGGGNNGADGYTAARRITGAAVGVSVLQVFPPKSNLCKIQADRAQKAGVSFLQLSSAELLPAVSRAAVIVDCILGSGFTGTLDKKTAELLQQLNAADAVRIACDVPTGLAADGTISGMVFQAHSTVVMGGLKLSLFSDCAKDAEGELYCASLGVTRTVYEAGAAPVAQLLEIKDSRLPHRTKKCVHKGMFGHAVIACGEKPGAAYIAGSAALRFGAGLVTLVHLGKPCPGYERESFFPELMTADSIPNNTAALVFGMGLSRNTDAARPYFEWLVNHPAVPCVLDADACYASGLKSFLEQRCAGVVLTPHPKEFQSLLAVCGLGCNSITDCVNRRIALASQFCTAFPGVVLIVKGANPLICTSEQGKMQVCINPLGSPCLAKAGSGDVLAGLTGSLLAQKYQPYQAAVQASLAHARASLSVASDYSLTPFSLIDAVARLGDAG
jgi:ADP-dependent NAD(P)H-hydrate dehydratase / NAD(P)H-hydrate epimerase